MEVIMGDKSEDNTTIDDNNTLLRTFQRNVTLTPDKIIYGNVDVNGKETKLISYTELHSKAHRVARGLIKHNVKLDDRVVLVFIPGTLDIALAFFACLLCGAIPVCLHPPDPRRLDRDVPLFTRTIQNCGAKVVLTNTEYHRFAFRPFTGVKWPLTISWFKIDDLKKNFKNLPTLSNMPQSQYAFIQYTSGSTSHPKGVIISQKSLISNMIAMEKAYSFSDSSVVVSWVPHFHDMGLVGTILIPAWRGATSYILSPLMFLSSPAMWMQSLSKYRCTHATTPAFGLVMAVKKTTSKDRVGLNLSNTKFVVGAEPIRLHTLVNFIETFGSVGVKEINVMPSYGIAEHVLCVSLFIGPMVEISVLTTASRSHFEMGLGFSF